MTDGTMKPRESEREPAREDEGGSRPFGPTPIQRSLPDISVVTETCARPNIAAEFARHQAIRHDREQMEAAKTKRARKAVRRLHDVARRAR